MVSFPNSFVERSEPLNRSIGQRGESALARLQEKGFTVATGLTEYFAGAISVVSCQESIREYCPKDATDKRFATLASTRKWLQKNGGRAVFLLLKGEDEDAQLEGYGWTGIEPNNVLPNHPVTSAYRIGERSQGKGLGKDFVQVIVSGTNSLYAPGVGIGLETWKSNPASSLYPKVGFVLLAEAEQDEMRQTFINGQEEWITDRRLYMGYPNELLV